MLKRTSAPLFRLLFIVLFLASNFACSKKVGCPAIDKSRLDKKGYPKDKPKSSVYSPKMEKQLHRKS